VAWRGEVETIETDVLVVGGGIAGCMAAIKAAEHDVEVLIAEKANTEHSGAAATGIDHFWAYIPPVHSAMGWSLEDLLEDHASGYAAGMVNEDLLYLVASRSYERAMDLERFGLRFRFDDSPFPGGFRVVYQYHSVPSSFNFEGRDLKRKLSREASSRKVRILNRVMVTDLLHTDGQVAGALAVGTRDGRIYVLRAKAVVLSTGRSNRWTKSPSGVRHNIRNAAEDTGDGKAMALRAGLGVINMEFASPAPAFAIAGIEINFGAPRNTVQPAAAVVGPTGKVHMPRAPGFFLKDFATEPLDAALLRRDWIEGTTTAEPAGPYKGASPRPRERVDFWGLRDKGEGPFFLDLTGGTKEELAYIEWSMSHEGKGFHWLHLAKAEHDLDLARDRLEMVPQARELGQLAAAGLLVDAHLETSVKGLFAAGDEVGGLPGSASPGAATMGWHAGDNAGTRAKAQGALAAIDAEQVAALIARCEAMMNARAGFHWSELELAVQNTTDYYCADKRSAPFLERGLSRLDELVETTPLKAANPHELARCLEVRSIVENAAMIMRASLAREESRPYPARFSRADFPEQDDDRFRCFLSQAATSQGYAFTRIPLR
jgi:succinate dehydrogenase/fumarate reductase flavoprotein subunit